MKLVDAVIVGAGMTGLMAAQKLKSIESVLLLEREEKVGGRIATQSVGPGKADLGAQFFTVHTPEFESWSEEWLENGLIKPWATGWSDASLTAITTRPHRRFIVKEGMAHLAEHLAQSLQVETNSDVESLTIAGDLWHIQTTDGRYLGCRALLLTPPVPLSLGLLDSGQVQLAAADRAALQRVTYDPGLVAVSWLDGDTKLPGLGAMQLPEGPIRFLVDNRHKGISSGAAVITTQLATASSREWWDRPDEEIVAAIERELEAYLLPDTAILESHLHRWHYALPFTLHPEHYLLAADLPLLVFAGDAFGSLRGIEGAALSGLAAGRLIASILA